MPNPSIYPDSFVSACLRDADSQIIGMLPTHLDIVKTHADGCGMGIFARRPFMRGELVGAFLAEKVGDVIQHSLQRGAGDYLHDPYFVGYLLHSCNPNVIVDMHQQRVYCIQDIEAGMPLTMDYASTEDTLFAQFHCQCGAPNCRGWVTGRYEGVNAEGKAYLATHAPMSLSHRVLAEGFMYDPLLHDGQHINGHSLVDHQE